MKKLTLAIVITALTLAIAASAGANGKTRLAGDAQGKPLPESASRVLLALGSLSVLAFPRRKA